MNDPVMIRSKYAIHSRVRKNHRRAHIDWDPRGLTQSCARLLLQLEYPRQTLPPLDPGGFPPIFRTFQHGSLNGDIPVVERALALARRSDTRHRRLQSVLTEPPLSEWEWRKRWTTMRLHFVRLGHTAALGAMAIFRPGPEETNAMQVAVALSKH